MSSGINDIFKQSKIEREVYMAQFIKGFNDYLNHHTVGPRNISIKDTEVTIRIGDRTATYPFTQDEYGALTLKMDTGFIISFMPPAMMRHASICGEQAASLYYSLLCAETNWHNEKMQELNRLQKNLGESK